MTGPEQQKASSPDAPKKEREKSKSSLVEGDGRKTRLSHEDAVAASPDDLPVAGEEDPGIGVEFMVREREKKDKAND